MLQKEAPGHTLQATALVHESWLRLQRQEAMDWTNHGLVVGLACRMMRWVLIDHARQSRRRLRVDLSEFDHQLDPAHATASWQDLRSALGKLQEVDPRLAQVVDLRFFGGMSFAEAAQVVGRTERTVKRDWNIARAFLLKELAGERAS